MANIDVAGTPLADLPALAGHLADLSAQVTLRLTTNNPTPQDTRLLTVVEAAAHAGVSQRWLRSKTRGLKCRKDLGAKTIRFDKAGLDAWLRSRKGAR